MNTSTKVGVAIFLLLGGSALLLGPVAAGAASRHGARATRVRDRRRPGGQSHPGSATTTPLCPTALGGAIRTRSRPTRRRSDVWIPRLDPAVPAGGDELNGPAAAFGAAPWRASIRVGAEATAAAVPRSPPLPHDAWGWYVVASLLYGALALATLSLHDNVLLLNWIIGPLFPVIVLFAIPTGGEGAQRRVRAR